MTKEYDLVVIGGGVGGYTGAIKAAKEGLKVALVEKDLLGGTCLNRGCIPTKAYLKSAAVVREVQAAADFGVKTTEPVVDFSQIKKRKDNIVETLRQGVAYLIKSNRIDYFEGEASILGTSIFTPRPGSVMIKPNDQDEIVLTPKNVLLATGSRPASLPFLPIDEDKILSSTGILELTELPKSIAIIGGGVIGVEWASLLRDLGVKVQIIEFQDRLIISENERISKQLQKEFTQRGIQLHLQTAVQNCHLTEDEVVLTAEEKGEAVQLTAEKVLVAVGRKPNLENIGLEAAGVEFDKKGIKVNHSYQTNLDNIYAIGDVIDTLQLAHVAAKEAELAVDSILGRTVTALNYQNIARGIYSYPEIASVGNVSGQVNGQTALKGQFETRFNGKALIEGEPVGQVTVYSDPNSDDFIGLSIVGVHATDLISEGALGLYLNATPEELGATVHPHPTTSEMIMEAARDIFHMSTNK